MIQMKIKDESQLYDPLDPSGTRISDSIYSYLKSFCTEMEAEKHIHDTLQVISDGPVDADRLKRAIQGAVQKDRDEFDRQIAANKKRAVREYILGILLSLAGVSLSIILDQVLLALISFLGTHALSEAFAIQTTVNPDIMRLKKLLDPFTDFELEVVQSQ